MQEREVLTRNCRLCGATFVTRRDNQSFCRASCRTDWHNGVRYDKEWKAVQLTAEEQKKMTRVEANLLELSVSDLIDRNIFFLESLEKSKLIPSGTIDHRMLVRTMSELITTKPILDKLWIEARIKVLRAKQPWK